MRGASIRPACAARRLSRQAVATWTCFEGRGRSARKSGGAAGLRRALRGLITGSVRLSAALVTTACGHCLARGRPRHPLASRHRHCRRRRHHRRRRCRRCRRRRHRRHRRHRRRRRPHHRQPRSPPLHSPSSPPSPPPPSPAPACRRTRRRHGPTLTTTNIATSTRALRRPFATTTTIVTPPAIAPRRTRGALSALLCLFLERGVETAHWVLL